MAILNIPSSPSDGDTYTANGVVYTWDGSKWKADSTYTKVRWMTIYWHQGLAVNYSPVVYAKLMEINRAFNG